MGTIGAEAISGASGGKVGIAGSLAINIADSVNEALIKSGAIVTLTGGDVNVLPRATPQPFLPPPKALPLPLKKKSPPPEIRPLSNLRRSGYCCRPTHPHLAGPASADLLFTLRNGSSFVVVLNGATTVKDVIDKINNAGNNKGKLVASFDEAKQQIKLTDTTTVVPSTSLAPPPSPRPVPRLLPQRRRYGS